MTPESWQAFFFDFDGVLADSVEVKTRAFAKIFEPFGPEIVKRVVDHHRTYGGVTRTDKFRLYYEEFLKRPLSADELAELCRRFSDLVVDEVVAAPEIPGVDSFLRTWQGKLPFFIISGTPEEELREIVKKRGLEVYFKEVLGAPGKKDEHLKSLLGKYSLNPGRCLFFGDAPSDLNAARVCGVDFIAILPSPEAPLIASNPEVEWAKDFVEIKERLVRVSA